MSVRKLINGRPAKSKPPIPVGLGSFSIQTGKSSSDSNVFLHRDAKLLSFGIGGEDEGPVTFKKKPIFRPDRKSSMTSQDYPTPSGGLTLSQS